MSAVKTWQERCDWQSDQPATTLMVDAMKAEISDLRAALDAHACTSTSVDGQNPTIVEAKQAEHAGAVRELIEHAARICEAYCVCDNGEDDEEINRLLRNRAAQIRGLAPSTEKGQQS